MTGDVSPPERTAEVPVVDPAELEPTEPVSGLAVRTPFRIDGYRMELLAVERRSGWHRRPGVTYGWVRGGSGRLEYGPAATDAVTLDPGAFLRVPAGVAHRYVAGEPIELLVVAEGEATPVGRPDRDAAVDVPVVVGPDGLVPADESPNLVRETPFPGEEALVFRVRAAGGVAAGWHHHGENVYFGYDVDGPSETEYGPGGREVAHIGIGECFHVPPGLVHRDTNPGTETHSAVVWLWGGEPWVVNVDGPAASPGSGPATGSDRLTDSRTA